MTFVPLFPRVGEEDERSVTLVLFFCGVGALGSGRSSMPSEPEEDPCSSEEVIGSCSGFSDILFLFFQVSLPFAVSKLFKGVPL